MPAEFTRVVRPPRQAALSPTIRSTAVSLVTSTCPAHAMPPTFSMIRAVSWAAAPTRSTHATRAPSAARRSAVACPMPEPAPVTSAIFPVIRMRGSVTEIALARQRGSVLLRHHLHEERESPGEALKSDAAAPVVSHPDDHEVVRRDDHGDLGP